MTRVVLFGVFVLTAAACSSDSAKDATAFDARRSDGVRSEQALPRGTRVDALIQTALSSRTNRPGESLHAIVSGDVKGKHGGVVIPAGSDVTLMVAELQAGSDDARPEGRFALVVSALAVYGQTYPMKANLDVVPYHLESTQLASGSTQRDVVVSAGTPIVFTLANSLNVSAK